MQRKMQKKLEILLRNEIDPAFAKRAKFIFYSVEKEKPQRVLDAGCGRGFYLKALGHFNFIEEIHGVDIVDKYLKTAKRNCRGSKFKIQKANIYSLPFPDNYFDCVICSEVLEHLSNDKKALNELKRVLKKEGTLLLTVPSKNFPFSWDPLNWILMRLFHTHVNKNIWWLAGIWADHERLYEEKEIRKITMECNLKIVSLEQTLHWCWPFSHFILYGIGKNIIELFGVKEFNRFNYEDKKITQFFSYIFDLPSNILDSRLKTNTFVNFALVVKKD